MGAAAPIARRDPAKVMRLKRLGSLHQCRLSFMRILTRRMARELCDELLARLLGS